MTQLQHKEPGTHEKGCECCDIFPLCQEWSCLGEKVLWVQKWMKVTLQSRNWYSGANESVWHEGVTWWAKRALWITQWPQSSTWLQGIPIWKTQMKQVIATRLWRIHLRWYCISTFLLHVKMHLWADVYAMMHVQDAMMHMVWCNATCNDATHKFL
jgi:hypothetical protein